MSEYIGWIQNNGQRKYIDKSTWLFVDPVIVDAAIASGDAIYCDEDFSNFSQLTSIRNEVYYEDSAITSLNSATPNFLGEGLEAKYTGTRDSAVQFSEIPEFANYALIQIQNVDIRYIVSSTTSSIDASTLRDIGTIVKSGDIIELNSRDELFKFQFISQGVVSDIPNAKVIITYYNNPNGTS